MYEKLALVHRRTMEWDPPMTPRHNSSLLFRRTDGTTLNSLAIFHFVFWNGVWGFASAAIEGFVRGRRF
jgi:hypothetical protein